ncbi:MAG: glycosyltransferase family A protein [Nibricoccus sp.]
MLVVDDSAPAAAKVSREFFGGRRIPRKDHRGGPYYSYFFALHEARNRYVLHTDADMLFGGRSQMWLAEACALFTSNEDVIVSAPLPGPPSADGKLRELAGSAIDQESYMYSFGEMSTRAFLIDRDRWQTRITKLVPRLAPLRGLILALLEGNPPRDLPENIITEAMKLNGLKRIDFLGTPPGMWTLHPPYRGADFFLKLPDLVRRVETGDLPPEQLGFHDICDQLVDWSEGRRALAERRWWRRLRNANRLWRES